MSRKPLTQREQEKRFEEMMKKPANRECFDCTEKLPMWASTNLGIFICLKCAGIHRSLGTHISKVKSTKMDKWEPEMLDFIERVGNDRALSLYRPNAPPSWTKPESGAESRVLEKCISDTYEMKRYAAPNLVDTLEELRRCVREGLKTTLEEVMQNMGNATSPQSQQPPAQTGRGGYSQQPAAKASEGTACSKCTYINTKGAKACAMCDSPLTPAVPKQPATTEGPKGDWSCSSCTFLNNGGSKCGMCHRPRTATNGTNGTTSPPSNGQAPAVPQTAPRLSRPAPTSKATTGPPSGTPKAPPPAPSQPAVQRPPSPDLLELIPVPTKSKDDGGFGEFMGGANLTSTAKNSVLEAFETNKFPQQPQQTSGPPPLPGAGQPWGMQQGNMNMNMNMNMMGQGQPWGMQQQQQQQGMGMHMNNGNMMGMQQQQQGMGMQWQQPPQQQQGMGMGMQWQQQQPQQQQQGFVPMPVPTQQAPPPQQSLQNFW